jgi:hypothetical protein
MKQISLVIIFCVLFVSLSLETYANKQVKIMSENQISKRVDTLSVDSLTNFLRNVNLNNYIGEQVDSFLLAIPNTPSSMLISSCVMGKRSMYNACYLQVAYNPDLIVRIYVTNFTHMVPYSPTLTWDIGLFRQENIFRISIYKNHSCINGLCRN